ncbi:choice-of-anchor P family protein [Nocardioides acrostichi]|uniref:Uncharacterized protein n=1 Tax=Nocardioides acrostichi TaxID=2784339 RepID=A0A930UW69_9ACTN|nr:choice-of-anchor P family protein [Nocardioides acrostichi]MBF4161276.1 hypothetical protein [Nocardioides acrostichi]
MTSRTHLAALGVALTLAGAALAPTSALAAPATPSAPPVTQPVTQPESGRVTTGATTLDVQGKGRTPFTYQGSGYGTSVTGGQVPVGSGRTGLTRVSCTSQTGKSNRNYVAEAELPGAGTVDAVSSKVVTRRKGTRFETFAKHKVASVVLADTPLGSLSVSGVVAVAKAFHTPKGFGTYTNTKIAGITFTPPVGDPQVIPIPTPGQPVTIPGLATLTLGRGIEKHSQHDGRAFAVALVVKVIPTETVVKVGRSVAKITDGYKTGIFHGSSFPAKASVLGDIVKVGRVINRVMPCAGTDGQLQVEKAADVNIGDQVKVGAAEAKQIGRQNRQRATGREASQVAGVDIGGQLQVEAIKSYAKMTRYRSGKSNRNAGMSVGGITLGGQEISLDQLKQGIEIPGLAKVQADIRKKVGGGIKVIGLRITLLDGTGAVVDLATSQIRIDSK